MKPKKRETQKQTSRVWLRNHDHRDVIYDLVYHNAMYLYKMKRDKHGQPTQQVETNAYVWFKYPHKYLLIVKIATAVDLGFVDIERQFVYSNPSHTLETAINGDKLIVVDDAVYLCNVYQDDVNGNYNKIRIGRGTIDGTTWRLPYQSGYIDFSLPGTFKIGLNCYCAFVRNPSSTTAYWSLKLVQITRDDDLHITLSVPVIINLLAHAETTYETSYDDVTATTRTLVVTETAVDYIMMGETSTGCVCRRQYIKKETRNGQVYNQQRQRWESDGTQTLTYYWQWEYWRYQINGGRECLSLEEKETPTQAEIGNINVEYFRPFPSVRWNCNIFDGASAPYRDLSPFGSSRVYQTHAMLIAYVAPTAPYALNGQVYRNIAFYAYMTYNEGNDWEGHMLGDDNYVRLRIGDTWSYENFKIKAFFREGRFYVMTASLYVDNWRVRMFSSLTGVSWEEVYLPKWLDVPFSTDAGIFTYRNDFADTVRIAISPSQTEDQDYNLYELEWDALEYLFTDGELDKTNEQFFITFMKKPYTTNDMVKHPGIFLFFDTKYLAENAQSFALKLTYETDLKINTPECVNSLTGIAEQVMDYDYCAPPGGFAGQDPDPETSYIYYVWDFTNLEWDIVDRHLSTYEHYSVIIVEDLPESGLANTLYAIRMDINKNNIYEYFVWDNGDYVAVKNLTLYSHYTVVMVQSLPYQGQNYIIYAVPLDFSSYTTNMYIWNPEAARYEHGEIVYGAFEDLNTTTYDMTGKKYNTVNVRRLPDTGRVGIIYISEEKYTPQVVTNEDNTYNFYQWDFGNGEWRLVSPVINKSKFNIIEVREMPPGPPAGMLKDIYKIPKELDGKDTHDMYKSESELVDFLTNHTFKHSTILYSKDQLPLVGTSDMYYIIKETPGTYNGKYTVYLYNVLLKEYKVHSEYEYWISDDPEEPKEVRKVEVIKDWVKDNILSSPFEQVEGE